MPLDQVNGGNDNEPKSPGKVFTEVRVRQFFAAPDGVEVLPTFVYFLEDGKGDVKLDEVVAGIGKSVQEQVPFPLVGMSIRQIGEFLASEITVGSSVGSQAKAAMQALPKPKAPKIVGVEPPAEPPALNS
jgi:hypothetical protein